MNIFDIVLVHPVINILVAFYQLFSKLGIPGALGFSIIAVTSTIRLIIHPLLAHQMSQSKKMQDLQPHISKLQVKHKGDNAKLQQAQAALYKEHNINPGIGCLVFIIQIPVFIGLYTALSKVVITNGTTIVKVIALLNETLYFPFLKITSFDTQFFMFDLVKMPSQWKTLGWWYLTIPVITALLQLWQSYLTSKSMPKKEEVKSQKLEVKNKDGKKEESKGPDFQSIMQKEMMILFPLMLGWMSFNFPIGLALYWNIFTLFGIVQALQMNKKPPLVV